MAYCVCVCVNRKKVDQQKEELDRLKAVLDSKEDMEKKQAGRSSYICGSPIVLVGYIYILCKLLYVCRSHSMLVGYIYPV